MSGAWPAACAFAVEGVDRAALERGERGFEEAGFVQRVGVDGDLHVEFVRDAEAAIDRRGRGAPVLVQLQADDSRAHLLAQRLGRGAVAFAEEADVHRVFVCGFEHAADVPDAGRASRGIRAVRRAGAAADHRGHAARERVLDLLRADEVDVRVDRARRDDAALARDDLRRRSDDHRDPLLDAGIPRMPDADDAPALDADVGFDDALHRVENQRIRDDEVEALRVERRGRLAHSVADDFAAAKFHLIPVPAALRDEVALDLDEKLRVRQSHTIAYRRPEHVCILAAGEREWHGYLGEPPRRQDARRCRRQKLFPPPDLGVFASWRSLIFSSSR